MGVQISDLETGWSNREGVSIQFFCNSLGAYDHETKNEWEIVEIGQRDAAMIAEKIKQEVDAGEFHCTDIIGQIAVKKEETRIKIGFKDFEFNTKERVALKDTKTVYIDHETALELSEKLKELIDIDYEVSVEQDLGCEILKFSFA